MALATPGVVMTNHAIAHGDVLATLRELPDNAFDALLTDPPYGLRFMGKRWDYDVPSVDVWREALRVLKPGAPLLSFGGSRTFHRIAVGIEDAGFELRDVVMWLYGKGFPKSLDVSKAIDKAAGATRKVVGSKKLTGNAAVSLKDKGGTYGVQVGTVPAKVVDVTAPATDLAQQWEGYGTALKPAFEPIIVARKPLDGTVAENVERWGVGGLAIDACRIEGGGAGTKCSNRDARGRCLGHRNAGRSTSGETFHGPETAPDGRWPANLCLDEDAAAALDASTGTLKSHGGGIRNPGGRGFQRGGTADPVRIAKGDTGGASRFFYCSKVSTREREYGCEHLPKRTAGEMTNRHDDEAAGTKSARAGAGGSTGGARNHHPTLKPIDLTRWLARLILPPTEDATLLVPYAGAGSEIVGALLAGWPSVFGIEGEADYVQIANARIEAWLKKEAA